MLPRSSSAQMEGCGEGRDAHIQSEVNGLNIFSFIFSLLSGSFTPDLVHTALGHFGGGNYLAGRPASPPGGTFKEPDPSLNLPSHSPFEQKHDGTVCNHS